jgi:predicted patatin/cPLA2 family phospholipase
MEKNITLKLDEDILKLCKYKAVESNKSLSKWVAELLEREIQNNLQKETSEYNKIKQRALKKIAKGYSFEKKPLKREEIHER